MPAPRELSIFARNLTALIAERGMSLSDAANLIGWSKADLSGVLKGSLVASVDDMDLVAAVFDVPGDSLHAQGCFTTEKIIEPDVAVAVMLLRVLSSSLRLEQAIGQECHRHIAGLPGMPDRHGHGYYSDHITYTYLTSVRSGQCAMSDVVIDSFAHHMDVPVELVRSGDFDLLSMYRKAARSLRSATSAENKILELTTKRGQHLEDVRQCASSLPDGARVMFLAQHPSVTGIMLSMSE